jgi:hypothetical protein
MQLVFNDTTKAQLAESSVSNTQYDFFKVDRCEIRSEGIINFLKLANFKKMQSIFLSFYHFN